MSTVFWVCVAKNYILATTSKISRPFLSVERFRGAVLVCFVWFVYSRAFLFPLWVFLIRYYLDSSCFLLSFNSTIWVFQLWFWCLTLFCFQDNKEHLSFTTRSDQFYLCYFSFPYPWRAEGRNTVTDRSPQWPTRSVPDSHTKLYYPHSLNSMQIKPS